MNLLGFIAPDGRLVNIELMTYGKGRINIGPADRPWYDDNW